MIKLRYLFTSFMAFLSLIILGVMFAASAPPGVDVPSVTERTESTPVPDVVHVDIVEVAGYRTQAGEITTPDTLDVIRFNMIGVTFTRNDTEVIRSGGES